MSAFKHGMSHSAEYRIWTGMIGRCHNPASSQYRRYGGRGIAVHPSWRFSFATFFADMGQRPSPFHSLDRINNDGNYEPGNCRWAVAKVQANNRADSVTARADRNVREFFERLVVAPDLLKGESR